MYIAISYIAIVMHIHIRYIATLYVAMMYICTHVFGNVLRCFWGDVLGCFLDALGVFDGSFDDVFRVLWGCFLDDLGMLSG